jgi:hypothetical protein
MVLTELNWLAVGAGFAVIFVTGAVWFGPRTFYPAWMRARGKDPDGTPTSMNMGVVFGSTALGALAQAITLTIVLWFVGAAGTPVGALEGALFGLLLGVGIAAASSLGHRLFGDDGFKVWAIEVGGDVLGLTLAGFVIGLITR